MLVEARAPAGVSGPLLKMLSLGFLLGSPYSTLPGCCGFSQADLGLCEMGISPHLNPLHFIRQHLPGQALHYPWPPAFVRRDLKEKLGLGLWPGEMS